MKRLINRLEEAQDTGADNILASFYKSWMDGSSDFKDFLQILRSGGKDANKIARYFDQDRYHPSGKGKAIDDFDLVSGKKGTTELSIMVNDRKPVTASISFSAKDGGDGLVSVKIYAGKNEEEVSVDEFLDMVRFKDI
jgi:hypothetical protein